MPETPIDQSAGIQSIRLKIPTGTVPIPPDGYAQLHSPGPGQLALRLPDGSVVAIGGGGEPPSSVRNLLGPNGQVLTDGTEPGVGIDISPIPPLKIRLGGAVVDANGQPQAPDAVTLVQQDAPPAAPQAGRTSFWLNGASSLGVVRDDGSRGFEVDGGGSSALILFDGFLYLADGQGASVVGSSGVLTLTGGNGTVAADVNAVTLDAGTGALLVKGLPTADPHVADQLWIAPVTRQLMVSAG